MKMFVLSYYYPPMNAPSSIQLSRLLKNLHDQTIVYCGLDKSKEDRSLVKEERTGSEIYRTRRAFWQPIQDGFFYLISKKGLHLPDRFKNWSLSAGRKLLSEQRIDPKVDILFTYANPISSHLAGLEIKKATGMPWIAYFSDPWTDNPFQDPSYPRARNLVMEQAVVANADYLFFTSKEAVELVMRKYPEELKRKTGILPHCFEERTGFTSDGTHQPIIIRHLGSFYGKRTPEPLFLALKTLEKLQPSLLDGVVFELIGSIAKQALQTSQSLKDLRPGIVKILPPVDYQESLSLMDRASALLVIDAPFKGSPFLPSKLIDYMGSCRPIVGLTPEGTSEKLIRELGGQVGDPSNPGNSALAIQNLISYLKNKSDGVPWGNPKVRARFSAQVVASHFSQAAQFLISNRGK